MKAIQKPSPAPGYALIDAPIPEPGPDDVLIKVSRASICGTDLHITRWDDWSASRIKPPLIFGHEFCGVIEKTGKNVTELSSGDYVSAEMHRIFPEEAGNPASTNGQHRQPQQTGEIYGIDINGCFAEYVCLPRRQVVKLPPGLPPEQGACLDSLGNAVHAVSKGEVAGMSVLVTGCGPIGLFAVAVAKVLGATAVYASDVNPYRLEMAKKAGADDVLDGNRGAVSAAVLARTAGVGVDVVLEMSGNPHAIRDAFEALRADGTYVMMGIPAKPVELDLNRDIIFKGARVIGCHGRQIFETWTTMLDLLGAGRLDIGFILTHHYPLAEFGQAIETVAGGKAGKVILTP